MSKFESTLEIQNFKSINNISITTSRVNIFFGKPNSGKSNLLEALTLFNPLQSKTSRQSESTIIRYNTIDNLFYDRNVYNDISVSYDENVAELIYLPSNSYLQLVNPNSDFLEKKKSFLDAGLSISEIINNSTILKKVSNASKNVSFLALIDQEGKSSSISFSGTEKENPIRRYEFLDGGNYSDPFREYLKSSGENLFTIVQENPKIREWITTFFEEFKLEFLIDFSSKKFEIQKKEKGIVYKIPFELTPDTLRRMLFYVAAIYSNSNTTILLEEPESHSFPPYIKELTELIKADLKNKYFITTHSPYFINSLIEDSEKLKDISFFHVYYDDYQTKVIQLTQKDLDMLWDSSADIFFNIDSLKK